MGRGMSPRPSASLALFVIRVVTSLHVTLLPAAPALAMPANQRPSSQRILKLFEPRLNPAPPTARTLLSLPPLGPIALPRPSIPCRASLSSSIMLLRSALCRNAPRAVPKQFALRSMASAATKGLQYDVSESAGVKVANREIASPTGSLVLVAKAGPRYQPFPGFTEALESFAFKVGHFTHCFVWFALTALCH